MRTLQPCGTVAAYQRHVRRKEKCNLCRAAEADRQRTYNDARRLLRERFPDEFAALRAQECRGATGWLRAMSALTRSRSERYRAILAEIREES